MWYWGHVNSVILMNAYVGAPFGRSKVETRVVFLPVFIWWAWSWMSGAFFFSAVLGGVSSKWHYIRVTNVIIWTMLPSHIKHTIFICFYLVGWAFSQRSFFLFCFAVLGGVSCRFPLFLSVFVALGEWVCSRLCQWGCSSLVFTVSLWVGICRPGHFQFFCGSSFWGRVRSYFFNSTVYFVCVESLCTK